MQGACPSQPPPSSPEWPGKCTEFLPSNGKFQKFHPLQNWLCTSQILVTLEQIPWISKGRSFPSFCKAPLMSALNKASRCSLPQGEETQCPEEMGRHIPHRDTGKSCLSAWSGCSFGVIYPNHSFHLNHNWMLQVAQPVLLRLEHPHWVRPVYKNSELNIFMRFLPCFFSWVPTLAIYCTAAPFPSQGKHQPFVSTGNHQHTHFPTKPLVSKHQPGSDQQGREQLVGEGNEYTMYAQEQTAMSHPKFVLH